MTETNSKAKKKELTPEQQNFLDILFSPEIKGNVSKALKASGLTYSPSQIIRVLGPEIRQLAEDILAMNSPLASFAMIDAVMDPNSAGISNKIKAAQDILDRVGIKKSAEEVKINTGSGLVVLPAKDVDPDILSRMVKKEKAEDDEV